MSVIYDSLKKGYKTEITMSINNKCRSYLISQNWDDSKEAVELILEYIVNNDYLILKINNCTNEEFNELINFLKLKIKNSLRSFIYQEPTAKQIYRYVYACLDTNKIPKRIMNNKEIWTETSKLEDIIKTNNE
jgi:hypothetical protein